MNTQLTNRHLHDSTVHCRNERLYSSIPSALRDNDLKTEKVVSFNSLTVCDKLIQAFHRP
jgi:hypothetical protein